MFTFDIHRGCDDVLLRTSVRHIDLELSQHALSDHLHPGAHGFPIKETARLRSIDPPGKVLRVKPGNGRKKEQGCDREQRLPDIAGDAGGPMERT